MSPRADYMRFDDVRVLLRDKMRPHMEKLKDNKMNSGYRTVNLRSRGRGATHVKRGVEYLAYTNDTELTALLAAAIFLDPQRLNSQESVHGWAMHMAAATDDTDVTRWFSEIDENVKFHLKKSDHTMGSAARRREKKRNREEAPRAVAAAGALITISGASGGRRTARPRT